MAEVKYTTIIEHNGEQYLIKDSEARNLINNLEQSVNANLDTLSAEIAQNYLRKAEADYLYIEEDELTTKLSDYTKTEDLKDYLISLEFLHGDAVEGTIINAVESAADTAFNDLSSRISTLETNLNNLESGIDALEESADIDALATRVDTIETQLGNLNASEAITAINGRIDTLESGQTEIQSSISSMAETDTALSNRITTVEETDTALSNRINTLESGQTEIQRSINSMARTDTNLSNRMVAVEEHISAEPVIVDEFPYIAFGVGGKRKLVVRNGQVVSWVDRDQIFSKTKKGVTTYKMIINEDGTIEAVAPCCGYLYGEIDGTVVYKVYISVYNGYEVNFISNVESESLPYFIRVYKTYLRDNGQINAFKSESDYLTAIADGKYQDLAFSNKFFDAAKAEFDHSEAIAYTSNTDAGLQCDLGEEIIWNSAFPDVKPQLNIEFVLKNGYSDKSLLPVIGTDNIIGSFNKIKTYETEVEEVFVLDAEGKKKDITNEIGTTYIKENSITYTVYIVKDSAYAEVYLNTEDGKYYGIYLKKKKDDLNEGQYIDVHYAVELETDADSGKYVAKATHEIPKGILRITKIKSDLTINLSEPQFDAPIVEDYR